MVADNYKSTVKPHSNSTEEPMSKYHMKKLTSFPSVVFINNVLHDFCNQASTVSMNSDRSYL